MSALFDYIKAFGYRIYSFPDHAGSGSKSLNLVLARALDNYDIGCLDEGTIEELVRLEMLEAPA